MTDQRLTEAFAAFQSGEVAAAMDIWEDLSEEDDTTAAWTLAAVHFNGLITDDGKPDFEMAAGFLRQAAARGHVLAQSALGSFLCFGCGVEKDESEARRWLQLAAERGDDSAQTSLGYLYENGYGGAEDAEAAIELYARAAKHGNANAQYRLGLANLTGWGVQQNAVVGLYWLLRAVEQGHAPAREKRDALLPYINEEIAQRISELAFLGGSPVLH